MDSPVLIFNPPATAVPDIIEDLCDPDLSMKDIAHEHQTTLAALVAWMARPEIKQQIRDFRSSAIERCKLIADNYLPVILKTCVRLIHEYNDDESNRLYHPSNWNKPEQQRRNREAARKTLYLMLRLHSLQLDEPVVHRDPSRARTRYQPIEEARAREPESRAIELEPPVPLANESSRRPAPSVHSAPSPTPVPVPLVGESSSRPVPSVEPASISSSLTTTSAASESPSAPSADLPPSPPEGRTTVAGGAAERGPAERSQPPESTPTSSSLSSAPRPSEGGPISPEQPDSTDDLLTELTAQHPELARAAQSVRAQLAAREATNQPPPRAPHRPSPQAATTGGAKNPNRTTSAPAASPTSSTTSSAPSPTTLTKPSSAPKYETPNRQILPSKHQTSIPADSTNGMFRLARQDQDCRDGGEQRREVRGWRENGHKKCTNPRPLQHPQLTGEWKRVPCAARARGGVIGFRFDLVRFRTDGRPFGRDLIPEAGLKSTPTSRLDAADMTVFGFPVDLQNCGRPDEERGMHRNVRNWSRPSGLPGCGVWPGSLRALWYEQSRRVLGPVKGGSRTETR